MHPDYIAFLTFELLDERTRRVADLERLVAAVRGPSLVSAPSFSDLLRRRPALGRRAAASPGPQRDSGPRR